MPEENEKFRQREFQVLVVELGWRICLKKMKRFRQKEFLVFVIELGLKLCLKKVKAFGKENYEYLNMFHRADLKYLIGLVTWQENIST